MLDSKLLLRALALIALVATIHCGESPTTGSGINPVARAGYLDKAALQTPPTGFDSHFLMQSIVVSTSSPNLLGDYVFPGLTSQPRLVDFHFTQQAAQVLHAQLLQADDPNDPNDDHSTLNAQVLLTIPGQHVGTPVPGLAAPGLDGQAATPTEDDWQQRPLFHADLEALDIDPVSTFAWYYSDLLARCATPSATTLVPDSYAFDPAEQHLSLQLDVTYRLDLQGQCADLVSAVTGTGTTTVRYQLSFMRRRQADLEGYPPVTVAEKDEVNRRFGFFQHMSVYRDKQSGLLDDTRYLHRWNPLRPSNDPVVFYFQRDFPPRYKPLFDGLATEANRILSQAGANLRFAFRDWNEGGIERRHGDMRYNFVVYHQDIDTTRGLLGYGPSAVDPRSGEILNAQLNLYNVGLDRYRFLIEQYLKDHGLDPNATTACDPTAALPVVDGSQRLRSSLFEAMRKTMELPEPASDANPSADFQPEPLRHSDLDGDGLPDFLGDYLRTLPALRYVDPSANDYVYALHSSPATDYAAHLAADRQLKGLLDNTTHNRSPFTDNFHPASAEGISAMNGFVTRLRAFQHNHDQLAVQEDLLLSTHNVYSFNDQDGISAIASGARRCNTDGTWETDSDYQTRIANDLLMHVAIHEFGHTLGLRHNFYGSVDAAHMRPNELSSSVMDYVAPQEEAGTPLKFGRYDEAALAYLYGVASVQQEALETPFLFCTDEHRHRSPLCNAHDLGVTPSQITLNAIERYDWLYAYRNRRAYRSFWDTSDYSAQVYGAIVPLQRMWHLATFDWKQGNVQEVLRRLDQVDPTRTVHDEETYDTIAKDFYRDLGMATDLVTAFYDAIVQQSAAKRNYQTEYDPFFGDTLRIGIINDKLFATMAFLDLQQIQNYDPNQQSYAAMFDRPFDSQQQALSRRVLDNLLGASYDTFPWFRFLALNLFSASAHSNLISNVGLRHRTAIERYETRQALIEVYGQDVDTAFAEATNPSQVFTHTGEQYVYTELTDLGAHLVASASQNPVSFKFMREYNEARNTGRTGSLDNHGLKTLLAYYEHYNDLQ